MPIAVKDFEWEQSQDAVFITVPLKGVASHKVDIISTEKYIKANYPPFIFECFLYDEVNDELGSVEVGNNAAIFKVKKKVLCMWPTLQNQTAVSDKELQKQLRQEALERFRIRSEERKKEKEELKHELGRLAVKQQMKLEESDRTKIEDMKMSERRKATEELEKWKEQQKKGSIKDRDVFQEKTEQVGTPQQSNGAMEKEFDNATQPNKNIQPPVRAKPSKAIFEESAKGFPVRQKSTITVKFTNREFPTPQRESMAQEEEEWLNKQAEARRLIDLQDSDLTEDERNPIWLLEKGNSFYKSGNYQAAVNVYSHAIRLQCKMPAVYSNRAACHLHLNNLFKSIEDSSKAIELLTPAVQQNKSARLKAHIRRGTAFCRLQMYVEGLMDYETALKLEPHNKELIADADKIRRVISEFFWS